MEKLPPVVGQLFFMDDRAATTARLGFNDHTIRPQRPHDSGPSSAYFQSGLRMPVRHAPGVPGPIKKRFGVYVYTPKRFIINVETFFKKPEG
jgi:hypothetical protein